jgi:Putative zinc-finger
MSALCPDLDPFFDGELSEVDADKFREHLATCKRCQATLQGRMLEEVVASAEPERVEQPRVMEVDARSHARRRRLIILAPLLAAAAAFVLWLVGTREHEQTKPIEVSLTIEHDGAARRGSLAHVGDVLRPIVRGGRHRAIWVYLGDRDLVTACPGSAECSGTNGELTLTLRVSAPGQYAIIALTSAEPITAPHGTLDAMLNIAATAGTHFKIEPVDVN